MEHGVWRSAISIACDWMVDYLRLSSSSVASEKDWWRPADASRAFGGQIIAHCIMAAGNVAPAGWSCHSLHLSFLAAGRMVATRYCVAPARRGRSYAVYHVDATETNEGSRLIARATVSFCRHEDGDALHADLMPTGIAKEPAWAAHEATKSSSWPRRVAADSSGLRWYVTWGEQGDGTGSALSAQSSPIAHSAALGFLSDHAFLWSAFLADAQHRERYDVSMLVSLDHTLHIHTPRLDAAGWLLYEMDSPFAARGRAVVRGRLWQVSTGELIASTVQEGVLRVSTRAAGREGCDDDRSRTPCSAVERRSRL